MNSLLKAHSTVIIVLSSVAVVRRTKRKKVNDETDSNSVSSEGYVSSSTEVKRLQTQVIELQAKLTSEKKKRRIAETENNNLKSVVDSWTSAFSQFSKLKPSEGNFFSSIRGQISSFSLLLKSAFDNK